MGLSNEEGLMEFTSNLDAVNHVLAKDKNQFTIKVMMQTLDNVLKDQSPTLIKIDVEGFENVLGGVGKH